MRALARLHDAHPRQSTIPRARLETALPDLENKTLVAGLLDRLKSRGKLLGDGRTVALPGHEPKLSQGERKLKLELAEAITSGGFSPPEVADLLASAGQRASAVPELLALLREEQRAVEISSNLYLDAEVERDLRHRVTRAARSTERRSRCQSCASCWAPPGNTRSRSANTSTASA